IPCRSIWVSPPAGQSAPPAGSAGLAQGAARLFDQGPERLRLADREIRENLAVDVDPGALHAVDELRVGQAMLAHAGIDALNPQAAEAALAVAAVAIGVLQPLLDALDGDAEVVLGAAAIAGRHLHDLLVPGVSRDAALHTCHGSPSSAVRQVEFLDDLGIRGAHHLGAAALPLHPLGAAPEAVPLAGRVHPPLAPSRAGAALPPRAFAP